MNVSSEVPSNCDNLSILDYLSQRFTYLSKEQWSVRIAQGCLLCNDIVADATLRVQKGDCITYRLPEFEEPEADLSYSIVYEDEWLLGINKPANLLVHRSGMSFTRNLIYQLRYVHQPGFKEANIINRLDRDTSGLVLVARNSQATSIFGTLFSQRRICKIYYAMLAGIPDPPSGNIMLPLKTSVRECRTEAAASTLDGKHAETRYEVVSTIGNACTLVRLLPSTGRMHQLRVHLAELGTPILFDKRYDSAGNSSAALPVGAKGMDRQALHCSGVSFIHPYLQKKICITAPFPADFTNFLLQFFTCDFIESLFACSLF